MDEWYFTQLHNPTTRGDESALNCHYHQATITFPTRIESLQHMNQNNKTTPVLTQSPIDGVRGGLETELTFCNICIKWLLFELEGSPSIHRVKWFAIGHFFHCLSHACSQKDKKESHQARELTTTKWYGKKNELKFILEVNCSSYILLPTCAKNEK